MSKVDLSHFEEVMKEIAKPFREIGLEIDRDPRRINRYLNMEGIVLLSNLMIPEPFNTDGLVIKGQQFYGVSILERVIALEQFAYGDAGVLLAAPGPSLSGQIILDMADLKQKERYYKSLKGENKWTFFALSEPNKGSDASNLKSQLTKRSERHYLLNGEKKYIGNGARAPIGVVFTRYSKGPLGINILLVDSQCEGFYAEKLDTLGVRGAELSHLKFENLLVSEEDIIGRHLKPTKRGLWGAIQTFNRMRPGVAALALGVASATMDYIILHKSNFTTHENYCLETYKDEIKSVRKLIRKAAEEVDHNASNGYLSSMAKIKAIKLVEELTEYAVGLFNPHTLIEHPFLNKWYRDARAFEFMEGTTNIQKMTITQNYLNGKMSHV